MVPDGSVVKYPARPEVYLVQSGQRHWIPDGATLQSRWSWNQVQTLTQQAVDSIPVGDPIPSVLSGQKWPDGALLMSPPSPAVYVMQTGQRRLIPDPSTFNANNNYSWDAIESVPPDVLNAIPLGAPVPSVIPQAPGHIVVYTDNTDLSANHWMNTKADLDLTSGLIRGVTRTWTGTWFGGFHGGVHVIAGNSLDFPVRLAGGVAQVIERFGVDGTADPFGTSDRTDAWTVQLDPTDAKNAITVYVSHTWDPDSFQTVLDKWLSEGKKLVDLFTAVAQIAKTITGSK
jgi:hypothetical protein